MYRSIVDASEPGGRWVIVTRRIQPAQSGDGMVEESHTRDEEVVVVEGAVLLPVHRDAVHDFPESPLET